MLRPAARALPCHQVAWVPTTCPAPSNRSDRRGQSASISLSSSSHSFARSSRALAHRSSNSTALRPSNTGATKRGQSEPSSAVTRSMSSASVAVSGALTGLSRPSWPRIRRAAEASTPLGPVTCSANSPSAAESTTPPPPPAADGSETGTPCRAPTAATAASMTLSTVAASASAPSCRPPSAPPRTLEPSRVPSATSTVTCLTQPSPSSQVFLTRSAMYAGRLPDGPSTVRNWSLTASESTGP